MQALKEWLNRIVQGDCMEVMRGMPDGCVDLVVTSPPYDDLRDYDGFTLDLPAIGDELFRLLKDGGCAVMVIQDQTKNGRKTLTAFKCILDWCERVGFGLFECAVYHRHGKDGGWWSRRLRVDHEYMPIFIKGEKPAYFNKEPIKVPCIHAGKTIRGGANRNKDGKTAPYSEMTINPMKCPGTVWNISNGGDKTRMKHEHPAAYPDILPHKVIQLLCPPDGVVLDPMVGSGSTAVAAELLGRKWIGIEVSERYCALARDRVRRRESNMTSQVELSLGFA